MTDAVIPGLAGQCVLERPVAVFDDRLAVGDERAVEVDLEQGRQPRGRATRRNHARRSSVIGFALHPEAQAALDADDPVAERQRAPLGQLERRLLRRG